jgi:hypothetical protein
MRDTRGNCRGIGRGFRQIDPGKAALQTAAEESADRISGPNQKTESEDRIGRPNQQSNEHREPEQKTSRGKREEVEPGRRERCNVAAQHAHRSFQNRISSQDQAAAPAMMRSDCKALSLSTKAMNSEAGIGAPK